MSTSQTRKRAVPTEKSEVSPRHPRRQGRQHLGAAARERARAEHERRGVREERPPRLHDPVRAQGPYPLATCRTSSSGSSRPTTRTFDRTLIVEVSGSQKSPGPTQAEGDHRARLVVRRGQQPRRLRPLGLHRDDRTRSSSRSRLADAIQALYDDAPIIGDPDLLDFD